MAAKPRYRPLILIVTTGISLSGLASWWVGRWERSLRQLEFERQTASLTVAMESRLNQYTETLLALGDFYAISQGEVSREQFGGFVRRVLDTYPGIQALEWAPWVRNGARRQFEQDLSQWARGKTEITEQGAMGGLVRAQSRQEYFPVNYIEPWQGNEVALGFDLLSNGVRSQALNRARQTGQVTATAPIRLVQEPQDQAGFLVFLPVYGEEQALQGMLLGVFRVSDVVEEAVRSLQTEINFTIRDQGDGVAGQYLGFYDAQTQEVEPIQTPPPPNGATDLLCPQGCQQIIAVSQRAWQLEFYPGVNYPLEPRWAMGATLTIGLLLTAIVALLGWNWATELEQTQAMGELKLKFFSMTSHEFRNPLSTILISSQFLVSHGAELADQKRLSIYQRIHEVARYMGQMLEDILMLSRAEAGHLSCHPEIVELEPLCRTILAELSELEKESEICYHNDYPYPQVFVDPKLIRSILTNLLNNAVKYSAPDGLVALKMTGNSRQLIIEVEDDGIGIEFTEQPYIFDPFYRGSNAEKLIGTGLGLAVVKTCVELHHGAIGLDSQLNAGTKFHITLPLEA